MDSLYNVPVQTLRGGTDAHRPGVPDSPSPRCLDCRTTSNQAPGLIFSQLYIELLSRKNG